MKKKSEVRSQKSEDRRQKTEDRRKEHRTFNTERRIKEILNTERKGRRERSEKTMRYIEPYKTTMTNKQVKIMAWIISVIILVPLTFMLGTWVFRPIGGVDHDDFGRLVRVLGIVTVFLIIVLFLPISKKYVKFTLAVVLFTFLVSGIVVAVYWFGVGILSNCKF